MGLFKSSKDKSKDSSKTDLLTPRPASELSSTNTQNPAATVASNDNSFNNSTASSSNLSSADTRVSQQPPGTTVTTTTTTTTTTTVVRSDGSTSVSTQQYNPSTDPPQNTNVVQRPDATTIQSANNNGAKSPVPMSIPSPVPESPTPGIQRQTTGGGRSIPPRSELRNSRPSPTAQSTAQFGTTQPNQGVEAARRNSQDYVSPIAPTQPQPNFPAAAPAQAQAQIPSQPQELGTSPPVHTQSQSQYFNGTPLSPTGKTTPNKSTTPTPAPNFSRPSAPTPNTAATHNTPGTNPLSSHPSNPPPAPPPAQTTNTTHPTEPTTAPPAPPKQKPSLSSTLKGLHGAGEAIRGSLNSRIASVTHDTAEAEKQRAIQEQGLKEYRESGFSTGGREGGFREKAEGRLNLRRKSVGSSGQVYGSAGPQGLTKVGEVPEERVY